ARPRARRRTAADAVGPRDRLPRAGLRRLPGAPGPPRRRGAADRRADERAGPGHTGDAGRTPDRRGAERSASSTGRVAVQDGVGPMPRFRGPKKVIGALPPPARTPADIPAAARPRLEAGERILAVAQEDAGGHWLVLTSYRLLERTPDGDTALERPWHEVDAGAWNPDLWVL